MPFVQQQKFNECLTKFFDEMTLPQIVFFPISNSLYKLTQPIVHISDTVSLKQDRKNQPIN